MCRLPRTLALLLTLVLAAATPARSADSATLVADLTPGPADTSFTAFTAYKGQLFFATGRDSRDPNFTQATLWSTTGGAPALVWQKTVDRTTTATYSMRIRRFAELSGVLFFSADGTLRKSDGATVEEVYVLGPGDEYSDPSEMLVAGAKLVMIAGPFVFDQRLYTSDGTGPGTAEIKVPLHGPYSLVAHGGALYFLVGASSAFEHWGLWRSDGTAAGTALVRRFCPADYCANGWPVQGLVSAGTALFFAGYEEGLGFELWRSDGTDGGTARVADLRPGPAGAEPRELTPLGVVVYFSADDGAHGRELWRSDGTAAGTRLVADINPGPGGSNPLGLTASGGRLFFSADDGARGRELWVSAAPTLGATLVREIRPGPQSGLAESLARIPVTGGLVFAANDGEHGAELWASDGTATGTELLTEVRAGPAGSEPAQLSLAAGRLYFVAGDETHGRELWSLAVPDLTPPPAPERAKSWLPLLTR